LMRAGSIIKMIPFGASLSESSLAVTDSRVKLWQSKPPSKSGSDQLFMSPNKVVIASK